MIDQINLSLAQTQIEGAAKLLGGSVSYLTCLNHRGEMSYKIEITYEDKEDE